MPKIKTHKGISKVIKVKKGGTIKFAKSGRNHNTGKKGSAFNRKMRKSSLLSKADHNRLKKLINK
jgi:large subunit ribosomal protein L35